MMKRLLIGLVALAVIAFAAGGVALAQSKPEFKLGFNALADQIPEVVGRPIEEEQYGPNGDSLQQTTTGLMAWRKADNWTAFTDGHSTWVNGPNGLESRLNSEPLPWEVEGTYSALLPSASGGGRLATLALSADGSCTLTTEFLGRPAPIVEKGTWSSDSGSVTVVLTEVDGRAIRTEITFEPRDGKLVSTRWHQSLYGSAGLQLVRQPTAGGLTLSQLMNAEYQSEFPRGRKAKLSDGTYQEEIVPGSATRLVIRLSDQYAPGDLDGDGAEDAAVILISNPGGSGTFYHLGAVLNREGEPQHAASTLLGDRVRIQSVSIRSGEIEVSLLTRRPSDAMALPPTVEVTRLFRLEGSELKLVR